MDFSKLATVYVGDRATGYDNARAAQEKWKREEQAVDSLLAALAPRSTLIDIPVGTGRFIELYDRHKIRAVGVDISQDMLREARKKARALNSDIDMRLGDIRSIDSPTGSFDVALCIRFLNHVEGEYLVDVLRELARVSKNYVIIGVSHYVPISELNLFTPKGLSIHVRRLRARWRKMVSGKGLVFHEPSALAAAIEEVGLTVLRKVFISKKSQGAYYFMYLLQKV